MTSSAAVVVRRSVYADRLLEHRDFTFSDGRQFSLRGAWREYFATRIGPAFDGRVIFEVGCNDGALLERVAARHTATAFVGIDWKCRALHTAAERTVAAGLRNVALLHGRAQDVARMFGDAELDEVWIFHPEPCDKPRERRNRLISAPFLNDVHGVMRSSGSLVLKTDDAEYYRWSLEVGGAAADRFDVVAASADFWGDQQLQSHQPQKRFAGEVTDFERRYRRKRRPIHYIEWQKR